MVRRKLTSMSASALCQQVFALHTSEWRKNAQILRRNPTVQAVHDLRVAGRKIRASLKLFRKILRPCPVSLDADLAAAGNIFGTARDLDVHLATLENTWKIWPENMRAGLRLYEKNQRVALQTARQAVKRHLQTRAFAQLDKTLESLGPNSNAGDLAASQFARKRLKKIFRKLHKRSETMKSVPTDLNLHRFRRAIRRMRYAALDFEPVGKPALKKLLFRLGGWQDVLGDRQDCLAGARLVSEYLESQKKALPLSEEQALIRLVQQLDRQKEQLQERVLLEWTPMDRRRLKHLLKKAI
jgi:CHAD domain-containing protein